MFSDVNNKLNNMSIQTDYDENNDLKKDTMDNFELIGLDEFSSFYDIREDEIEDIDYKICPNCDLQMSFNITHEYMCTKCGFTTSHKITPNDEYGIVSGRSYNSLSSSSTQLKCIGQNSHRLQNILRNNSSYDVIQENNIKNLLFHLNYNNSSGLNIPRDILLTVSEQYKCIRSSGNIYRGQILKGILAALTYYECLKQGLTHKPKEIAAWFKIDSNNLSKGEKIVRSLTEEKKIELKLDEIEVHIDNNFINSYAKRIDIDNKYIHFLHELLIEVDSQKIVNLNSKPSTKAVSLIYLLIVCKGLDISQDDLYEEFKISRSTFKQMTSTILKNCDKLSHVFEKYNIKKIYSVPRAQNSSRKKNIKKKELKEEELTAP